MTCLHLNFRADVVVARLLDADPNHPDLPTDAADTVPATGFSVDVHLHCVDCDEAFRFLCPDVGLLADRPARSVDGLELRVPAAPASAPADFGLNRPGFRVQASFDPGREN